MKSLIPLLLASCAFGQGLAINGTAASALPEHALLRASDAFLASAIALDAASSFATPGPEANPLLNHQWGPRQAVTLAAMTGGLLIGEHFMLRRWPKLAKPFAIVNFAAGAPHVWAGVHNLDLRH
jgi:hypothetical protein